MATKHTHQMIFGKRVAGCPRCAELDAGAQPIKWSHTLKDEDDARRSREIRSHFDSEYHRSGKCGPVCTYGDW